MGVFRTVPVMGGTTLRRGGSTKGDQDVSNVIGSLAKNDYTALVQCAGEEVTDEHRNSNYWWVLLDTPLGRGWVSAVRIAEGGNDQSIDGVTRAATVFDVPWTDGTPTTVTVVSGGATLRMGGSRKSDPDNVIGSVAGGHTYAALAQCGGQDIKIGTQFNFRWVLLDTPEGPGWVSEVLIVEGPNGGPIPGVPQVATVFSTPPDLIE